MELLNFKVPDTQEIVIAPIGDFQWSGKNGPTALSHIQDHIARCMDLDAWFFGLGDYIDFMSPSNRQRLRAAALYDTAEEVIDEKAMELVYEIFELALKPTVGRWIGLVHGHHYSDLKPGDTTDTRLAEMLKATYLGTQAIVRVHNKQLSCVLWAHHGKGGGTLPAGPLNTLYHASNPWERVDVFLMGHTTKSPCTRLSRPYAVWSGDKADLKHRDILLVNTGGFSKSNIVGHKAGRIPRGDYAEEKMLPPSPLSAPIIRVFPYAEEQRITVEL